MTPKISLHKVYTILLLKIFQFNLIKPLNLTCNLRGNYRNYWEENNQYNKDDQPNLKGGEGTFTRKTNMLQLMRVSSQKGAT